MAGISIFSKSEKGISSEGCGETKCPHFFLKKVIRYLMSINYLSLRNSPLSTITGYNVSYSTLTGNTIKTNTISVNSVNVVIPTSGTTSAKISISNLANVYVRTSDIKAEISNYIDNTATYTFGQAIQNRWFSGGYAISGGFSNDGINWSSGGNIATLYNNAVYWAAYNGTIWVAGGAANGNTVLAYSYDGITWIPSPNGISVFSSQVSGVAWNGTLWAACGHNTNSVGYSYDGINWIGAGINLITTYGMGIAYGQNKFIAYGQGTNSLIYSLNGINWTASANGNSMFSQANCAAWNGIRWVACGSAGSYRLAYSADGITWTASANGNSIFTTSSFGVAWNGVRWVACGQGTNSLAYSTDGITWTASANGNTIFPTSARSVSWNGTRWVAVGLTSGTTSNAAYSLDGITWTLGSNYPSLTAAYSIAANVRRPHTINYPQNLLVANTSAGTNSLIYSTDGITWAGATAGAGGGVSIFSSYAIGLAWNGTMWLSSGSGTNNLAYSYDGVTWVGLGTTSFGGSTLAWGNNMWIIGGNGTQRMGYSYDGFTWINIPNATNIFNGGSVNNIAYGGSRWVATGNTATATMLAYSNDGITWTATGSGIFTTAGSSGIAYNGSRWAASGTGINTLAWSTDGITWYGLGTTIFSTAGRGIAWNGQRFVAGGQGTNSLAYSADGINWTGSGTAMFSSGSGCIDVKWNGARWVAGGYGTNPLVYSADGITWTASANGGSITSTNINSIAWNGSLNNGPVGNVFIQHPTIACGAGANTLAYSPDGIQWTGLGSTVFTTQGQMAAWNGQTWIAGGSGTNTMAYSADGQTWVGLGSVVFGASGNAAAWNGSIWVAVGQCITNTINYSTDGIKWVGLGTSILGTGYAVAWNGTQWVSGGAYSTGAPNVLAYSANGITWNATTGTAPSPPASPYVDLTFNGVLTDSGSAAIAAPTVTGTTVYSSSRSVLLPQSLDLTVNVGGAVAPTYALTYSLTLNMTTGYTIMFWMRPSFITSDYSVLFSLTNGAPASTLGYDFYLRGAAAITTQISGNAAYFNSATNVYAYDTWTHVAITFSGTTNTTYLNGVLLGSGNVTQSNYTTTYLVIGAGRQNSSSYKGYLSDFRVYNSVLNTTQISAAAGLFTQCNGLVWGNNTWVAVGQGAYTMAYSTNGTSWTGITSVFSSAGNGVTWNGTRFVAVGTGTYTIMTSLNGTTWANVTTTLPLFSIGYSVCWNQTRFVATGAGTTLIYSPDGLSWYNAIQPNTPYIYLPFEQSYLDVNNNSTITLAGGWTPTYVAGTVGSYAINFPNTAGGTPSYYLRGSMPSLNVFSVTGWFKATALGGYNIIYSMCTGMLVIYIYNGNVYVNMPTGGGLLTTNVGSSFTVSAGTWYSFAVVFQAYGLCYSYVNGVQTQSFTNTLGLGSVANYTQFGLASYDNSLNLAFNGYIDDLRIYNYALSPAAAQNLAIPTSVLASGYGIASNPRIGAVVVDSQLTMNGSGYGKNNKLDIVSDSYFQNSYKEFSATVTLHNF